MKRERLKKPRATMLIAAIATATLFSCAPSTDVSVDQAKKLPPVTTIYVSEIICDPKNDHFEFHPQIFLGEDIEDHIKQNPAFAWQRKDKLEVHIQSDPKLLAVKRKEYGIFFNGKFVSETEFHHSCMLKDVQIDINVDYTKARTRSEIKQWCEKDIPDFYREYAESIRARAQKPLCIKETNGGVTISHQGKRVAYWDYSKYGNTYKRISYKNKETEFCSRVSTKCRPGSLEKLIRNPVFSKPYSSPPRS